MGIILFIKLGESKIRYLRGKIFIEEHIRSLDVTMDNFQSWFFMEISQASGYTNAYLVPRWPIQMQLVLFWTYKAFTILIDKYK